MRLLNLSKKSFSPLTALALTLIAFATVQADNPPDPYPVATPTVGPNGITWQPRVSYSKLILAVSGPQGAVTIQEFPAGAQPTFKNTNPNGSYTYELRVVPVINAQTLQALKNARAAGDAAAIARLQAGLQSPVQTGAFSISNSQVLMGNTTEPVASSPRAPSGPNAPTDQVIPDDLIVQGSACVGLDCVNNEVFGFDTIRMKENNTRIQFEDTSSAAGFPTNNWQIRANSSSSGGDSFLGFVDQGASGNSETGTIVFLVNAGAPANSLKVSSTGKVGLRTATPVLDLHINTGDTPAMRLEQNSGGGFTAQTWDVAGNEANFFIRDVTGGSRLPLRIRPGAPTSSIDIAADGKIGMGIASPVTFLHLKVPGATDNVVQSFENGSRRWSIGVNGTTNAFRIADNTAGFARLTILNTGSVGIGTETPLDTLHVAGEVRVNSCVKNSGGTAIAGTCVSDERLKKNVAPFSTMLDQVTRLQPVYYDWRADEFPEYGFGNEKSYGLIAQEVERALPDLVAADALGFKTVNYTKIPLVILQALKELRAEKDAEISKLETQ